MRALTIPGVVRLGWAVLLAATGGPAFAAPYCVQSQALPPQCDYYDPSLCQENANRQGGVCAENPQEARLQPGIGQYCVVTAGGASNCSYADRGTCAAEAQRQKGACVEAPAIAPAKAPDPYSAVNGL
ncbi:MAG TPA: hypothetical protein VME47_18185 [Acetobacteraceae bacterium]|nr:hypothetical protein [Acetobacteraceae bacterium]